VSFGLLGKFERAIECFETAIWIDASNAPAWYNKGMTLKVLRGNDEAEIALAKARELGYRE
jgi:tetratricopeptide (TPR) repeat protein